MIKSKRVWALLGAGALMLGMLFSSTAVVLADGQLTWAGPTDNGATDGNIDNIQCDSNHTPYLYWVLASSQGITGATITFGGTGSGGPFDMNQDNGTWKYQNGPLFDLSGLTVTVNYTGNATGNPHITLSHGCPGAGETAPPSNSPTDTPPPSFQASQEGATDAPTPSFQSSQEGATECPCDTITGVKTSGPADGAWLLVVALGLLLASIVVLTPARAKGRR